MKKLMPATTKIPVPVSGSKQIVIVRKLMTSIIATLIATLITITQQALLAVKSQRFFLPLFAGILILQIICGQTAAAILSERQPIFALAVQQTAPDPTSAAFVKHLKESSMFTIHEVNLELTPQEILETIDAQGLVVTFTDFEQRISESGIPLVNWYTAPGINDSKIAQEQVADVLLQLRAEARLNLALDKFNKTDDSLTPKIEVTDLIQTTYYGPDLLASVLDSKSGFDSGAEAGSDVSSGSGAGADVSSGSEAGSGAEFDSGSIPPLDAKDSAQAYVVSALLVTLAFLHAAMLLPQKSMRRLLVRGRKAWFVSLVARLLAIWFIWLVIIAIYFIVLMIFGIKLNPDLLLCFVLIVLYVTLLGGLITLLFKHAFACWFFVPLFLLNMTLGGGIWGATIALPTLTPLLPVSIVLAHGSNFTLATISLLLASAFCLLAILLASFRCTTTRTVN
ncbi:MAG: hypothetical protein LBG97_02055 [Coriobacteriales bacterium]|jgi:hypothetical protein|nr:hypothetical protein [Coriobacteriales bacterium]